MIVFYDIGTENDSITTSFSSSIMANNIMENLQLLNNYARENRIKAIKAIDPDQDKRLSAINPLLIKINEINEIELKNMLIEHNGELFVEKKEGNIFLNPNLKSILSFFYTTNTYIYGITKTEELFKTAIAFNQLGIKTSIIEDAILPINMHDINIKEIMDRLAQNNILLVNTSKILMEKNGLHIL